MGKRRRHSAGAAHIKKASHKRGRKGHSKRSAIKV
jgi:nicotinic acid phosphoribosyltransferase